jgi:hypothetical protein
MGKSGGTDGHCRRIKDMPFIVRSHTQLELSPEIEEVILVETQKAEYLSLGVIVGLTAAMPFTTATVETPGEINVKSLKVVTVKPDNLVAVARSHAHISRSHNTIFTDNTGHAALGGGHFFLWGKGGYHFLYQATVFGPPSRGGCLRSDGFSGIVGRQADGIVHDGAIQLSYPDGTVGSPFRNQDDGRVSENVFLPLLADFHGYFRTQVKHISEVSPFKDQAFIIGMNHLPLKRVKQGRLLDKPEGKLGFESLQISGFHPDTRLGIEPRGRVSDQHGFDEVRIFFRYYHEKLLSWEYSSRADIRQKLNKLVII